MPFGGARSATLERMSAVSLVRAVRGPVFVRTTPRWPAWRTPTGWRLSARFLLPTFLCGGAPKEVPLGDKEK